MKKKIYFTEMFLVIAAAFMLPMVSHAQNIALDMGFGFGGKVVTAVSSYDDFGSSVVIQGDGKIVVAGHSKTYANREEFALARYNSDGSLDPSFGAGGIVITDFQSNEDYGKSVAIQGDGKIVVAGYKYFWFGYDFALARYNVNGTIDSTFDSDGKVTTAIGDDDFAFSVAIQNDGKILVAGRSSGVYPKVNDFTLVRYNSNGSLDPTFDLDGIATTDFGNSPEEGSSLAIQADDKIVVAGSRSNGSNRDFALVRYNEDGSLDNNFGSSGKVVTEIGVSEDYCTSVAIQPDGKIMAAGYAMMAGQNEFVLVRYNNNGSLDSSFQSDGIVTTNFGNYGDAASSMALQPDGKIVLAGTGNNDIALARYNSDGSLDSTFDADGKITTDFGNSSDGGSSVAIQNDGKIVVSGGTNFGSSNEEFALVRYQIVNTGIKSAEELIPAISVFPNPTSGMLSIKCDHNKNSFIQLFNLLGEKVLEQQFDVNIDLSVFPKGIYFLKIYLGEKTQTQKIVIQ